MLVNLQKWNSLPREFQDIMRKHMNDGALLQRRDCAAVETALKSNPIVVIKTNTAHDAIPQTFIPIVVKNTPSV